MEELKLIKEAEALLRQITLNNNQTGILWLRHLRFSVGYLIDAITEKEKAGQKSG
jgi:hypothetical protein